MSKPFTDLKFCSTSVPSELRSEITSKIKAMGGTHSNNLMSDVDVLIVGDRNTEKFKFSVRNRFDIIFIKPDVILKIHNHWLNNEDQKDENLIKIENYSLPIFENFNICLSRTSPDQFISSSEKSKLIEFIKENSGLVSDSLTTTSSCLITNEKSGKRYEMSKKWQIPIIHPLWILDSLKRKATLDFKYYDIESVQFDKIGQDSCKVWDNLKTRKRKKIVLEDHEEKEYQLTGKRNSKIWNSIMKNNKDKDQISSRKSINSWDDQVDDDDNNNNNNTNNNNNDTNNNDNTKRNDNLFGKKKPSLEVTKSKIMPIVTSHLFQNLTFKIELFPDSKKSTLTKVIESHSGRVIDSEAEEEHEEDQAPSYILIPCDFAIKDLPTHMKSLDNLVTEWFIERCLHYNTIKLDDWGKPFYNQIEGDLTNLNISITGFQGIELLHCTKIIKLLKIKFHEVLNNERDLLLLNIDALSVDPSLQLFQKFPSLFEKTKPNYKFVKNGPTVNSTKKKIQFAKQKNIPIVSITYLFAMVKDAKVLNLNHRDWCIYCPKLANLNANLKHLIELDPEKSLGQKKEKNKNHHHHDNEQENNTSPSRQASLPQLPSPIRNKRKDNWGRLVGRASKSQFNSLEIDDDNSISNDNNNNNNNNNDDDDLKMPDATQISYEQSQTSVKLLKLLNKDPTKGTHSTTITNNETSTTTTTTTNNNRKRTRAGYKEMLGVLDDE